MLIHDIISPRSRLRASGRNVLGRRIPHPPTRCLSEARHHAVGCHEQAKIQFSPSGKRNPSRKPAHAVTQRSAIATGRFTTS
jgi:hypothetical protein